MNIIKFNNKIHYIIYQENVFKKNIKTLSKYFFNICDSIS